MSEPVFARLAPHLYLQGFPRSIDDERLSRFLDQLLEEQSRFEKPFAWIADCSHMERATPTQRKLFAAYERRSAPLDREHCAGVALFTEDSLRGSVIRGVITAVYWLSPPVYPHRLVSDPESAVAFCRERLEARGVDLDVEMAVRRWTALGEA